MWLAAPLVLWSGFFSNADLVTAYVAIVTAGATGIWAIKKHADDRRSTRDQQKAQADRELLQRQDEAREARQQRAAELIKAVGDAAEPRARRWTMSALALYPDEALDLLLAALGEADDVDASAIKVAVLSLGADALPEVVRYHRIAGQLCSLAEAPSSAQQSAVGPPVAGGSAPRIRDCTREILVHLLLQLDDEQRAQQDLAGVDLSGVILARARLVRAPFRKVTLDRAVFGHANLRHANLRGATVAGTVFTRADLTEADLTGAQGAVQAVRADFSQATLDQADLSGSKLDAARFHGASLRGTVLAGASLAGASLAGATLEHVRMTRSTAHHLAARGVVARHLDASRANLADSRLDGARIETSKLAAVSAPRLQAQRARLVEVNLDGAHVEQSDLTGAELTGCVLGGADLSTARLGDVLFSECRFGGTTFAGASLPRAHFRHCTFTGRIDFTGVDLSTTAFAGCRFAAKARLVVDNASWQGAELDAAARAAFESAVADRQVEPS